MPAQTKSFDELANFILRLKSERFFATLRDEASTKQGIVLPVLTKLGWDTFNVDEVVPERGVAMRKVDYGLRLSGKDKVFIEVKNPGEELERHQEQLLDYAFKSGVKLAVLTNGQSWWFYLPLQEGSWEQRKFYTVDIVEREPRDVAARMFEFLSKELVGAGVAVENAEATYQNQQKTKVIMETLPRAWDQILSDPDDILIDLIAETTEKLCGYKPDAQLVEEFFSENKSKLRVSQSLGPEVRLPPQGPLKRTEIATAKGYTGRSITGFTFRLQAFAVGSWIEVLMGLCNLLHSAHGVDFGEGPGTRR